MDTILPSAAYKPTARSRVKRLPKRGAYDHATVHAVLDAGLIGHVGYAIDGQPFVTPTAYWREGTRLYWHGSSASRMLRHLEGGVPACLAATHLDGLVLSRSAFHHSINYRSVMAFGVARLVSDPGEKAAVLDAFVDRLYPGRRDEVRPPTAQELKATKVIVMPIDEASAKIRAAGPGEDEEDYAIPCWAGVIPVRQAVGEAVPDVRLAPGTMRPQHIDLYRDGAALDAVLSRYAGVQVGT